MVEVRRQNDDLLADRGVGAGDDADDVAAGGGGEAGPRRCGERALERDGRVGRVGALRFGDDRGPGRRGALEQRRGGGLAQRTEHRGRGGGTGAGAVGLGPGGLGRGIAADQRRERALARTGARGIQHDDADGAAGRRDLRLGGGGAEIGALLAGETRRRSGEDRDDLAAHVHAPIVVDAELRRDDAATGEDDRCGDAGLGPSGVGAGDVIGVEHERPGASCRVGPAHRAFAGSLVNCQRHVLQVAAGIARRAQARRLELRRYILRRDVVIRRARFAAAQGIGGEEHHVRTHRGLIGRQDGCGVGRGHLGRAGLGGSGRDEGQRGKRAGNTDHAGKSRLSIGPA
ncbi:hypothetical protein WR25_08964 [Diploscapter pachys]|uniref:Uncharacterized protein n=1 Tax=Diploscapter pachys TaxID=2018661 RepID=A0A2A2KKM1_9BILA|nr:hypothetical protein WR25_08964 [Diploscapter pachys]